MPTRSAPRLSFFYAAIFLVIGVQLPFWPVWLAARGLGAVEIGAVMALGQGLKTLTTPLAGMLADRSGDRRRTMLALAAAGVVSFAVCLPARGFAALAVLTALTGACLSALIPLGDNLALVAALGARLDYGRMRLWGTLAFILATLLSGNALAGRDADVILYLLIGASAVLLVACQLLPRLAVPARAGLQAARGTLLAPRFLVFLAAGALVHVSHSMYYAFGPLHWQALGFSSRTIALLWAEGAAAEIALFFWGAPLVLRCGALGLVVVGGAGGALRWAVNAITQDLALIALAQLLHAPSFAVAHLGAMHFVAGHAPEEHSATAQALYAAVCGVAAGVVVLGAGALYNAVGGGAYFAMSALAAFGAALAVILARGAEQAAPVKP
ncbi:MAG TPA: MFS transporter [Stellaceae bacterium]|nr:MFS transporter [Stellaceae bacterium]